MDWIIWVFKHHQALHLPAMFRHHNGLLSCFLMERFHKRVKRFMMGRLHTQSYEHGILCDVTLRHLHELESSWNKPCMDTTHPVTADVAEALRCAFPNAQGISEGAFCRPSKGIQIFRGDTVLTSCGKGVRVCYIFDIDGAVHVGGIRMDLISTSIHTRSYRLTDAVVLVSLKDVLTTVVQRTSGTEMTILVPVAFRRG